MANILGISAYYHDSAACLLRDGEIIAAAQEERFTRRKHDAGFPSNAARYCLREGKIDTNSLDVVAFYEKPLVKFSRILDTYLSFAPRGLKSFMMVMPLWLRRRLWMRDEIKKSLEYEGPILFSEHHESHAASAFFPSPFERSAFLTMDGVGEMATSSYGIGDGNRVELLAEMHFPHSLGLLYSAFTYFTGFKVNSGEYKIMGLAPYGEPKYVQKIYDHILDLKEDGSFKMNMRFFDYCAGLKMTNDRFEELFEGPPRKPETNLTQREMDLARSVQDVTEEVVLRTARHIKKETQERFLCLAGGVALNCVANGKLLRSGIFDDLWIQPAAGDAGGAIGAAYVAYHHHFDQPVRPKGKRDLQKGSCLGPEYSESSIAQFINENKLPATRFDDDEAMIQAVVQHLVEGKIIGWLQGRMEFGPRALGNRSIIGDPRSPEMQKRMNLKIKFRESFRPFAPSVLVEETGQWFDLDRESPYMLLVAEVRKDKQRTMTEAERSLWGIDKLNVVRSQIPAVTHVDYSARIQTVHSSDNSLYYRLINRFFSITGCPVLVNTSFNVRGEPIVESPKDAYICFMRTGIDVLVMGNYAFYREAQPPLRESADWKKIYELD
jgi:carbamoyltransferase